MRAKCTFIWKKERSFQGYHGSLVRLAFSSPATAGPACSHSDNDITAILSRPIFVQKVAFSVVFYCTR